MAGSVDAGDTLGAGALRKASWRLLPLIFLGYGIAYIDRVNISFAALQMNADLHFSASVYGLGGGLFFLSYALLEVPSNLMLVRYGARRWIARIMLTWGVLAVGMMFVRTPLQFYCMRFLLGAAEAGFFPGAVYYLTHWFPAEFRGRAITRFYVALPLSSAVMGAVAGALLDLNGTLGLAGWQWLFLVEGLPAIVLGLVVLAVLPAGPADARWLSEAERLWILRRLGAEREARGAGGHAPLRRILLRPRVLRLGLCNLCILGGNYAFILSTPAVLQGVTHWSTTRVGLVMPATALLGAVGMIATGAHSDRARERHLHAAVPALCVAAAYVAIALSSASWVVVPAYVVTFVGMCAVQAAIWLIPSDELEGREAAVGLAAIGSIGMLGSFTGPYAWGLAKDYTGGYQAGLLGVAAAYAAAAALLLYIRHLGHDRARAVAAAVAAR